MDFPVFDFSRYTKTFFFTRFFVGWAGVGNGMSDAGGKMDRAASRIAWRKDGKEILGLDLLTGGCGTET